MKMLSTLAAVLLAVTGPQALANGMPIQTGPVAQLVTLAKAEQRPVNAMDVMDAGGCFYGSDIFESGEIVRIGGGAAALFQQCLEARWGRPFSAADLPK